MLLAYAYNLAFRKWKKSRYSSCPGVGLGMYYSLYCTIIIYRWKVYEEIEQDMVKLYQKKNFRRTKIYYSKRNVKMSFIYYQMYELEVELLQIRNQKKNLFRRSVYIDKMHIMVMSTTNTLILVKLQKYNLDHLSLRYIQIFL